MHRNSLVIFCLTISSAQAADWRPRALAATVDGRIYVADSALPGIWEGGPSGPFVPRFRASEKDRSPLRNVVSLAVSKEGTLFAGDSATGEIYRVDRDAPPKPLSGGAFEVPTGLAIADDGTLYVCDLRLNIVAKLPGEGGRPETIAAVAAPRGLATAGDGGLFVLSSREDPLVKISSNGDKKTAVAGRPFRMPLALAVDRRSNDAWIADGDGSTVWKASARGEARAYSKAGALKRPVAVALDGKGGLIVADAGAGRILRIDDKGAIRSIWNGPGSSVSRRDSP